MTRMFLVRVPGQGSKSEFVAEAADHVAAARVYALAVRSNHAPIDHEIKDGKLMVCGSSFVDVTLIPHCVERARVVPWAEMQVSQIDLTDFTLVPQIFPEPANSDGDPDIIL